METRRKRRLQFHSREEREANPRASGLASRAFLSIARTNSRLSRYHEIIHLVPLPPPPNPSPILQKYYKYSFQFLLGTTVAQEESEDNTKAKF